MPRKTRVCKYMRCKHGGKIQLEDEKYIVSDSGLYFHEDCHQEKCDMALVRDMWVKHVSPTVVHSQLNKVLYELLDLPTVTSGYLVFVMQYIVDNQCKLRYPNGFKYYVDRQEIKDAYKKKNQPIVTNRQFVATQVEKDDPVFSIPKKASGFGSILGGK